MLLNGLIYEYSDLITLFKDHNGSLVFKENGRIRIRKKDRESIVCSSIPGKYEISNYVANNDGIWVVYNPCKKTTEPPYVRHLNMLSGKETSFFFNEQMSLQGLSNGYFVYLVFDKDTYMTRLCKVGIDDFYNSEPISKNVEIDSLVIDKSIIFSRTRGGEINCISQELNTIWTKTFENVVRYRGNLEPLLYEDTVIVNIGVDKSKEQNCGIISFDKANGDIIWRKNFPREIANCLLADNKLLVAYEGRLIVMDPMNGKVLVDEPSGFQRRTHEDTLWSDKNLLIYISCEEATIRIFSEDGNEQLQELEIPYPFAPIVGDKFVIYEDDYYLPLTIRDSCLQGAFYGILRLRAAGSTDKLEIVVEQRPTYRIGTKQNKKGQDYCHIIFVNKDAEKIIKYGPILIKEYVNVQGSHVLSDERRNINFCGRIIFSTNLDDFSSDDKTKISNMVTATEHWFDTMSIRAGNRKDKIDIELRRSSEDKYPTS